MDLLDHHVGLVIGAILILALGIGGLRMLTQRDHRELTALAKDPERDGHAFFAGMRGLFFGIVYFLILIGLIWLYLGRPSRLP